MKLFLLESKERLIEHGKTNVFKKFIIKLYSFIGLHFSTYQMTKVKGQF